MKKRVVSKKDMYTFLWLKQRFELTEDPEIPVSIGHLVNQTLKNYFSADFEHQRVSKMALQLRGKTDKLVFQMSNGSQQIKLYEPQKYKNHLNTPLRIRSRTILQLANNSSCPDVKERIRELHRTYPYYLLKEKPEDLKLLNFRFDRVVRKNDPCSIFRIAHGSEPHPDSDSLVMTVNYHPQKTVNFRYEEMEEQYFYAVNTRNNNRSNILRFIWCDELQQIPE